jgi:hypothetical protein
MTATTATLADLFLAGAPATRAGIEVAGYVVVVEYHAATRTADVRSAVQIDDSPGPIVYGVPVQHPEGGGHSITWGLSPGDVLLGVVRSRSHDEVDDGAEVPLTPASSRRFDWSDQVVIPGGRGTLPYREDGQMVIGLPDLEALFLGSPTAAEKLVLVTQLRDFLVSQRSALVSHVHPGVTVGGGSTGASATVWPAVPSAQDLASERLLVDG